MQGSLQSLNPSPSASDLIWKIYPFEMLKDYTKGYDRGCLPICGLFKVRQNASDAYCETSAFYHSDYILLSSRFSLSIIRQTYVELTEGV